MNPLKLSNGKTAEFTPYMTIDKPK
jgi:hypothetical protein